MAGKSDYLEQKVLNHQFNLATYVPAATVYLRLFTTSPGDAGGGVEVSGGAYVALTITNDATEWTLVGSTVINDNVQEFAEATTNWGTITSAALFDAPTGGNLLYYGNLNTSRVVNTGDQIRFVAGAIVASED